MHKKYKLGVVVGRFQIFHNGHKYVVDKALEECEKLIICIGSCNERWTKRNPLDYEQRKEAILKVYSSEEFKDRLIFIPLVDIGAGDSEIWGNYVINTCEFVTGDIPEVYYSGTESDRNNWLKDKKIKIVNVSRNDINISATEVRKMMIEENDEYKKYIPEQEYYLASWIKYLDEKGYQE